MKLSRRGILKALPALPLATKKLAEQATVMAGVAIDGKPGLPEGVSGSLLGRATPSMSYLDMLRTRLNAFLRNGIPGWRVRQLRRDAAYNRRLDPDIACLNSVSLGHRLRMQEQLTLQRMMRDEIERMQDTEAASVWGKREGIEDDYY